MGGYDARKVEWVVEKVEWVIEKVDREGRKVDPVGMKVKKLPPKLETFEDFMQDIHAEGYMGTDDDMPDKFEGWIGSLDNNEIMEYAELYGANLQKKYV